jgi:hypothetical protein
MQSARRHDHNALSARSAGAQGCFPDGSFGCYAASRSPASAGSSPRVRIAVSSS